MKFSDLSYDIRVELNTENFELSADEIADLERGLDPLREPVANFPVCDLYINIVHQPRSNDFYVKTSLVLTGRTLFTGDHDVLVYPAFERCIRKLVKRVERYKANLGRDSEISKQGKGTHQKVEPAVVPEADLLTQSVANGDYAAFRRAMYVYDESLRKRIGRWVQRYPELDAAIDDRISLEDIVEEILLTAFDEFEQRPPAVPLSEWLDGLIDKSIKELMRHPEEELENINFVRSIQDTPLT